MDVLAKEAGVARATVYEHFRSKRVVLDELASSTSRSLTLDDSPTRTSAIRSPRCATCSARCAGTGPSTRTRVRELRTLAAVTGADSADDGVDDEHLRCLVEALAAAGQLRAALVGRRRGRRARACSRRTRPTSGSRRSPRARPTQVEALLAKLAVSIVAPNAAERAPSVDASRRPRSGG